jgi:hypothetical protein
MFFLVRDGGDGVWIVGAIGDCAKFFFEFKNEKI